MMHSFIDARSLRVAIGLMAIAVLFLPFVSCTGDRTTGDVSTTPAGATPTEPADAAVVGLLDEREDHDHDEHGHGHDGDEDHPQGAAGSPGPDAGPGSSSTTNVSFHGTDHDETAPCTCDQSRAVNGWCVHHGVGWVAGLVVPSASLFEALDAHGHEVDPTRFTCPSCLTALETDGYCESCRWGFVNQQLYVSKLTWSLARGTPAAARDLDCERCLTNLADHGWCDACQAGQVGPFRFTKRDDYELAASEQARLVESVATLPRCEECAIRMFTGGTCRICGGRSLSRKQNPDGMAIPDSGPDQVDSQK